MLRATALGLPMTTLIVAAFAPELAPYGAIDGTFAVAGQRVEVAEVGIGLVASALGAAEVLRRGPSAVIFSGTCGAYPGGPATLEVAVSRRIHLVSPLAVEGRAHLPARLSPPIDGAEGLGASLVSAGAVAVDVATTLAVTTDEGLARAIAGTGCLVEHMEAYAVAAACERAGVPFVAVLGVANVVGPNAHAEWKANHEEAARRAALVVRRALRSAR
jgi:purine-nucleoside phosphorylase